MKMFYTVIRCPEGYVASYISPSGQTTKVEMNCNDPVVAIDRFKLTHPNAQYVDDATFGRIQEKIEADARKLSAWNAWAK